MNQPTAPSTSYLKPHTSHLKIISAGAGSGKTYRLMQEMVAYLRSGVRPSGIIATTFTHKAAAEIQERVRIKLLEEGMTREAEALAGALIGTVHSMGAKLLKRFAFYAGVSPAVEIMADEDAQGMFNRSLAEVLTVERMEEMEQLSERLGLSKNERYDWRKDLKNLCDVARGNDFGPDVLEKSRRYSWESLEQLLGKKSDATPKELNERLLEILENTLPALEASDDSTQATQSFLNFLRSCKKGLQINGGLHWHEWAKISKAAVGAKSRDTVADLKEFAQVVDTHPSLHADLQKFIELNFEIVGEALTEFENYKRRRGLIDYVDMEIHLKRLLDHPQVRAVLAEELDLVMVDEFQDTNPVQLEIFLRLAGIAKNSVWVGDPKQSIYGFRGADPELMQAIIREAGGIRPENILEHSWRSRRDIVFATNSLFTKAFADLPPEQVALQPKREDAPGQNRALIHWHFEFDGESKRPPGKPWFENCIALQVKELVDGGEVRGERREMRGETREVRGERREVRGETREARDERREARDEGPPTVLVVPKGEKTTRPLRPGDIGILCRSNDACADMAEALHRAGLKAALARAGLLATREVRLALACLKFILNKYDALSVAEILRLAEGLELKDIVSDRLDFLKTKGYEDEDLRMADYRWAEDRFYVRRLAELRPQVVELSSAEILNLVLDELDLRRIVVGWGFSELRIANLDRLRRFALDYEDGCNRSHAAATLGGFLLWLDDLEAREADTQSSGENPDAVNVLTYHKSKGLEFPVVICHNLEGNLRDDVWGIGIVRSAECGVRSGGNSALRTPHSALLRLWINPYADQIQKTALDERVSASPAQAEATRKALAEEARLLYVGMTRARDYLIVPSCSRPTKWLNRVMHHGIEEAAALDPGQEVSLWDWEDEFLVFDNQRFTMGKDFETNWPAEKPIEYLEPSAGKQIHIPYRIDWQREGLPFDIRPEIREPKNYAQPLTPGEENQGIRMDKLLPLFLLADDPAASIARRLAMAEKLTLRWECKGFIAPEQLLGASGNWWEFLKKTFGDGNWRRGFPVRFHFENRLFEGEIDFCLELGNSQNPGVIIQNHPYGGDRRKLRAKAAELATFLWFAKMALEAASGKTGFRTFVNFPLLGEVVEIAAHVGFG